MLALQPACFKAWILVTRPKWRGEKLSYFIGCDRSDGLLLGDIAIAVNEIQRLEHDMTTPGGSFAAEPNSILIEPVSNAFQPDVSKAMRETVPTGQSLRLCGGHLHSLGLEICWDASWRKSYRDVRMGSKLCGLPGEATMTAYRSRFSC